MVEPMRVAILSHFGGFQSSYALHVGWHERARLLERFLVDFDFLVNEKCKEGLYPNQVNCLPNPPSGKPFGDRVEMFAEAYRRLLGDYDVILTADMMYQRKGNFLAHNAAQRAVANELKAWWCHWIHSSWTTRPPTINKGNPEHLRYVMPPRSFIVYLNSFEVPDVAKMYNARPDQVYAVYNPKDIRSFYEMDPVAWEIIDILSIPNKRAIQIFPFCTTRMDAKGIDGVIHVIAAIKRKGIPVALILANANSRKRPDEIAAKTKFMENLGLRENKDFLWTSKINNDKPISRKTVADLFKVSNLFTFTSWRETVGNVFQEAKISGCQLVLNYNLPCLREMGGPEAIYIQTSFKTPGVRDGQTGDLQLVNYNPNMEAYFDEIAGIVLDKLPDRSYQWFFSLDRIWVMQMEPLLRRAYTAGQGVDYKDIKTVGRWVGPTTIPAPMEAYGINKQWGKDMTGAPLIPGTLC